MKLPSKPYLTQAHVQKILDAANQYAIEKGHREEMINHGRHAFLSVPHLSMMLEGGINIVVDGHTIGAVGVSGVKDMEDSNTAKAGIAAILN